MRAPIQEVDVPTRAEKVTLLERFLRKCNKGVNPFRLDPEMYPPSRYYYSTEYDPVREKMFLKKDPFFTTSQRLQMVWDTVQRLTVPKIRRKKKKGKLALLSLNKNDTDPEKGTNGEEKEEKEEQAIQLSLFALRELHVYCAVYPIHDGEAKEEPNPYIGVDPRHWPSRKWLYEVWGCFGQWTKYQPLDEIAGYFGVRTGLYFAWLGKAWFLGTKTNQYFAC